MDKKAKLPRTKASRATVARNQTQKNKNMRPMKQLLVETPCILRENSKRIIHSLDFTCLSRAISTNSLEKMS